MYEFRDINNVKFIFSGYLYNVIANETTELRCGLIDSTRSTLLSYGHGLDDHWLSQSAERPLNRLSLIEL